MVKSSQALSKAAGAASVMLVLAVLALVPAAASAAPKRCGTVGTGMSRVRVLVTTGPVSCVEARKVARAVLRNAGPRIGKWRCDGGAGGFGCVKSSPYGRILALV